jgi:hypothetical protein
MKTSDVVIDQRQLPAGYIYCFNDGCPKHEECLRWIATKQMDAKCTTAHTVLPKVLSMKNCPHYRKAELKRMAWGFNKLFAEVKSKDETLLRNEMKSYLGGNGTYSRYKLGRRLLTPAQQEHIIALFRARGYTEGLEFDHYVTAYDFDH